MERKIASIYINALKTQCHFNVYSENVHILNIIDRSLTWASTPQGRDYWHDVHYDWKKYFREKVGVVNKLCAY